MKIIKNIKITLPDGRTQTIRKALPAPVKINLNELPPQYRPKSLESVKAVIETQPS
jgi:hypothetical protein